MNSEKKGTLVKKLLFHDVLAFVLLLMLVWVDELYDLPHLILGAEKTPINWREALVETVVLLVVGAVLAFRSYNLSKRVHILEGFLPICAECKKIRDDQDDWHQIESYITKESEAKFSHTLCPECAEKLFPGYRKKRDI